MKEIYEKYLRWVLLTLAIIAFIAGGGHYFGKAIIKQQQAKEHERLQQEQAKKENLEQIKQQEPTEAVEEMNTEEVEATEETTEEVTELEEPIPEAHNPDEIEGEVPEGFYQDTLFIGDSRTVGLSEYGQIPEATFFANSGMSVYDLEKDTEEIEGLGTVTLDELLGKKAFKRIYIMIGINELGYNQDVTIEKYRALVQKVMENQKEAQINICANMHVTYQRSQTDTIFNNTNIDILNQKMYECAQENHLNYIDVNVIFDDENHALAEAYSNDDTHPIGRYYKSWTIWLARYQRYPKK